MVENSEDHGEGCSTLSCNVSPPERSDRNLLVVPSPPANGKQATHRKPPKVLGWRSARKYSKCNVDKIVEHLVLPHLPTTPARRRTHCHSVTNAGELALPHLPARRASWHIHCHSAANAEGVAPPLAPAKRTRRHSHCTSDTVTEALAVSHVPALPSLSVDHTGDAAASKSRSSNLVPPALASHNSQDIASPILVRHRLRHNTDPTMNKAQRIAGGDVSSHMRGTLDRRSRRHNTEPTMNTDQCTTDNENVRCGSMSSSCPDGEYVRHESVCASFQRARLRANAVEAIMNGQGLFRRPSQEPTMRRTVVSSIKDKLANAFSAMEVLEQGMPTPEPQPTILRSLSHRHRTSSKIVEGMQKSLSTAIDAMNIKDSDFPRHSPRNSIDDAA